MAGTLHGDRAPIAHGRRVLRHGRAPKGADVELFCILLIPVSSLICFAGCPFLYFPCRFVLYPLPFFPPLFSFFERFYLNYVPVAGVYLHPTKYTLQLLGLLWAFYSGVMAIIRSTTVPIESKVLCFFFALFCNSIPHKHVIFTIPDTLRELFKNPEGASQPI